MKFFVIIFVVITAVAGMPSENNEKSVFPNSDLLRILQGTSPPEEETLDVCNIYSYYISKTQQCAGTLVDAKWVLTTCRCAIDAQEGEAKRIAVQCGKSKEIKKTKAAVLPTGMNGATVANGAKTLDMYDVTKDTTFFKLPDACLAMIPLLTPYDLTNKLVAKATITIKATLTEALTAFPEARYCGLGEKDLNGTFSDKILCAETNLVNKDDCKASKELRPYAAITAAAVAPATDFLYADGGCALPLDANVCRGDIGAPVFGISRNADSTIKERNLLGIVGGSVTYNSCGDNHVAAITTLPGNAAKWVAGVIAGFTVAAGGGG